MVLPPVRWCLFLLATSLLLVALLACAEATPVEEPLVVRSVPWGDEEAHYTLQDGKGKAVGTVTLTAQLTDGVYLVTQQFVMADTHDRLEARVRAADLKPISTQRVVEGKDGELRIRGEFSDGVVAMSWITAKDLRSRQVSVPSDVYDNGAALFLWRTLPFAEGYAAFYRSVNASLVRVPEKVTVRLKVTGLETVAVPAGSFDAWRVEVRAGGERHIAWYAVGGTHPLVKYDNSKQVFLLESITSQATKQP